MPVTSITATVAPFNAVEVPVATLAGGPFDNVAVFQQGGDSIDGQGQLLYKLYALVGTLQSLIATSQVLGSPKATILQWQSPGSGASETQAVEAGGTSYIFTVTALPPLNTGSSQPALPRNPVVVTIAGVNELDVVGDTNISPVLVVPSFTEVSSVNVSGFSQLMDVAVNQANLPQQVTVTVYANNGVGSVEAVVSSVTLSGPDAVTAVLRKLQLPVASTYRIGIRNDTGATISVPISIATYSVAAVGGGGPVLLTPAPGEVGASGPSNSNVIPPGGLFGQVLTSLGTGTPTKTSEPLATQWISPTNNPTWNQATWFIDPANSTGLASDDNSGVDALHPVLTYNGGVVAKWGTSAPTLRQNTTLTWLSSQPPDDKTDPVIFTPVMLNCFVTLQGVTGAAQIIHSGVLGAVTPKNRAAGQLLKVDLGFAIPVPPSTGIPTAIVHNTTKDSWAWVYRPTSPPTTTWILSQPLTTAPIPATAFSPPAEVDTWAPGDAFDIYEFVGVNLCCVQPLVAIFNGGPSFEYPVPLTVTRLRVQGANTVAAGFIGADDLFSGSDVAYQEAFLESIFIGLDLADDENIFQNNTNFGGGVTDIGGSGNTLMFGGILQGSALNIAPWVFDGDVIIGTDFGIVVGSDHNLTTPSSILSAYIDNQITPQMICNVSIVFMSTWFGGTPSIALPGGTAPVLWGPGQLDSEGPCRISYPSGVGAAVACFQNTGGLKLNGQASASTFVPATGTWGGLLAITPANLDAVGGFNGLALNMGGSSITNQGTP
jgi:hypothetical protein